MLFYFPDKIDQKIYSINNYNRLGSSSYDGTDLKINRIDFRTSGLGICITVSNDFIFLTDYKIMLQVTKNSNYSEPNVWNINHTMVDIKVYTGTCIVLYCQLCIRSFNVFF